MSWIAAVLVGLVVLYGLYVGVPTLAKPLIRRSFLKRIEASGAVCLTFDDGPDPDTTPLILDLLAAAGAKATFFVVGENVDRNPELTRRIVAEGHQLGEHSYHHSFAWTTGPIRTFTDLARGGASVEPYVTGSGPRCLRPPFGKLNMATIAYAATNGRRLAWWNVDPNDYDRQHAEPVVEHVLQRLRPGAIVLLHDGRRTPSADKAVTVEAVRQILASTGSTGSAFLTVTDALAAHESGVAQ